MNDLTQEEISILQELAKILIPLKEKRINLSQIDEKDEWFTELITNIAAEVFKLRYKQDLTIKEVAKKANLPEGIVYDIETLNGYGNDPSIQTLFELFYALGHYLYITPFGKYSYTVPEEYRTLVDKKATEFNLSTEKWLKEFFEHYFKNYKKD
jgi:transcriptional regulator with XRE-family HTH domain